MRALAREDGSRDWEGCTWEPGDTQKGSAWLNEESAASGTLYVSASVLGVGMICAPDGPL
jgi:hypothetical protein